MSFWRTVNNNTTLGSFAGVFGGRYRGDLLGAAVGAGVGAAAGSIMTNGDAGVGAAVGAGVGLAAAPALGLATMGAGVLGSKALKHSGAIAGGAMSAGATIGKTTAKVAAAPFQLGIQSHMKSGASQLGAPLFRYGRALERTMGAIGGSVLKYQPETYKQGANGKIITKGGKMKLGKGAIPIGIAAAGILGAKKVSDDYMASRSGTPSGTQRATPSLVNPAGASGDLVFALNANRRG